MIVPLLINAVSTTKHSAAKALATAGIGGFYVYWKRYDGKLDKWLDVEIRGPYDHPVGEHRAPSSAWISDVRFHLKPPQTALRVPPSRKGDV